MSIGDILRGIGSGAAKVGRVAGTVLEPIAEEESGQMPEIEKEKRQRAMQLQDASIAAQAQNLEQQLAMGRKYGTLNPQQQQQYVDAITQLYSHPSQQGTLIQKLHKVLHPNGATYTPNTPLANATPQGGTVAADEAERQKLAAEAFGRQEALIDRRAHDTAANREPKPLKSEISGNVFLGVSDPNTGKTYSVVDLSPGGSAPDEAKALYQEYQTGRKAQEAEKEKQWEKQQAEIDRRQERTEANMLMRQQLAFQNMLSMGNFRAANTVVQGLEKNYSTSTTLENRMKGLAAQAFNPDGSPNQQAQLAILANHIAMTTHQPGAAMRPTKALFDEAAAAQPWLQSVTKRYDPHTGVLTGVVLSKQQVQQMVDLAPVMVNADLQALNQAKELMNDQLNPEPATPGKTGAKSVKPGQILPKAGAQPTSNVDPLGIL